MRARLPGIGAHHSANPQTDEWYTPPHIINALGAFDLDPCAPQTAPHWTGASTAYTADHDGLNQPWTGRVWLNPPYSEVEPWMARLATHGTGTALVFARTETRWWMRHVWPHAHALLFLAGRVSFWAPGPDGARPSPSGHNSGGPSVLIAYGEHDADRLGRSGLPGALVGRATPSGHAWLTANEVAR